MPETPPGNTDNLAPRIGEHAANERTPTTEAVAEPPGLPGGVESYSGLQLSALRLYWFAVATCGLIVPFWVYQRAREEGIASRSTRIAWAIGSLNPVITMSLLYRFHVALPAGDSPNDNLAGWRRAGPAALMLVLLLVCAFSPLEYFLLAPVLLWPLPVVWVQYGISRRCAELRGNPARPRAFSSWWHWVIVSVGTLALLGALVFETPAFVNHFRWRKLAGDKVSGQSAAFELVIPTSGWRVVESGTYGDDDADLELAGPGEETWAVAYVHPRSSVTLDELVSLRRDLLLGVAQPSSYDETHSFLWDGTFEPVAITEVGIDQGFLGSVYYRVLATRSDKLVLEIVTYTSEPSEHAEKLKELLKSFALKNEDEAAGDPG